VRGALGSCFRDKVARANGKDKLAHLGGLNGLEAACRRVSDQNDAGRERRPCGERNAAADSRQAQPLFDDHELIRFHEHVFDRE
jgi:hypothetical protein